MLQSVHERKTRQDGPRGPDLSTVGASRAAGRPARLRAPAGGDTRHTTRDSTARRHGAQTPPVVAKRDGVPSAPTAWAQFALPLAFTAALLALSLLPRVRASRR